MKIFDTRIPIHETPDGEPSINETIENLDEMLTRYGIEHCFTLPTGKEIEADEKTLVYYLFYLSEQNVEMTLVVSLFMRMYLKKDKQNILESIMKSFENH